MRPVARAQHRRAGAFGVHVRDHRRPSSADRPSRHGAAHRYAVRVRRLPCGGALRPKGRVPSESKRMALLGRPCSGPCWQPRVQCLPNRVPQTSRGRLCPAPAPAPSNRPTWHSRVPGAARWRSVQALVRTPRSAAPALHPRQAVRHVSCSRLSSGRVCPEEPVACSKVVPGSSSWSPSLHSRWRSSSSGGQCRVSLPRLTAKQRPSRQRRFSPALPAAIRVQGRIR